MFCCSLDTCFALFCVLLLMRDTKPGVHSGVCAICGQLFVLFVLFLCAVLGPMLSCVRVSTWLVLLGAFRFYVL